MNERELGRVLLQLDAGDLAGVPDARQPTWRVLERDRRRVRLVTGMTLVTWLAGLGLVLWALVAAGLLMPKHAKLMTDIRQGQIDPATRDQVAAYHQQVAMMLTVGVGWGVAVLAMAALCTLLLVRVSRQATLRQLNASLLAISEQLQRLQPTAPSHRP
jgi:hypothetical protein